MKGVFITLISVLWGMSSALADTPLTLPNIEKLPELGSPANTALNPKQEINFGRQLFRELRQSQRFIEDPEIVEWINQLGQRLVQHASGRFSPFYFGVAQDNSVNAYALPGGVVVINSGLITRVRSESELAAVMAHEVAHITQRHTARQLQASKATPWITGLGLLAGAAASKSNSDAAEALIVGTLATNMHQQLSYSRAHETEADRIGLRILAGAGFDPNTLADFLEQLERGQSSIYGDITKYLSTHPLGIERLSDVRSSINQFGRRTTADSMGFKLMQTKIRFLARQDNNGIDPLLQNYNRTLTTLRYNQAAQALAASQKLPTNPTTAVVQAQALNANQRYSDTLKRFLSSVRLGTTSALLIPVAEALVAQGQASKAWQFVNSAKLTETTSLEFLEYKQQLAQKLGYSADAMIAVAERSLRLGAYKQAKLTLEQAQKTRPTPANRQVITQRLAEIKQAEAIKKELEKF
ncbi:M48 family metallopeptidase [Thiofilum flexile]|uniref:M48 family metallopeptidase n=1 Tax=Thiofilum flexile TaxID=125627 RepID=UPI00037AC377|nr:M48 family metalloprotease [Thiofilum flexile]